MQTSRERRRAKAMAPEDRRDAIVEATLPLIAEHGANVTTKQIATAADIAEGTVFRVFTDKAELLMTCLRYAANADQELARIAEIDSSQTLEKKLVTVAEILGDYLDRIWRYAMAMREFTHGRPHSEEDAKEHSVPAQTVRMRDAVAEVFAADEATTRISPQKAAHVFTSLIFGNRMRTPNEGGESLTHQETVDLFLHGLLERKPRKKASG